MNSYWITFTDGTEGCCSGENESDAKRIAEHLTGKTVSGGKYKDFAAKVLPYPALPIIWQYSHPVVGKCPTFCYTPRECAGKTSCPKRPACSE